MIEAQAPQGFWQNVGLFLSGKRFAPLGARESGKSTFMDLLTTGVLRDPDKYVATKETVPTEPKRVKIGDHVFYVKSSWDVSGAPQACGEWKRIHQDTDYVVYFVNIVLLDSVPEVAVQVRGDLQTLAECRSRYGWWQSWPPSVIAVTHCDKLQNYYDIDKRAVFEDSIKDRPLLRQLALVLDGSPDDKIAVGSMVNMAEAESFVNSIMQRLK